MSSQLHILIFRFSQMIYFFFFLVKHTITEEESFINLEGKMFRLFRFSYNISDKVRNDFFVLAIPEESTIVLDYWFSC